MGIYIGVIEYKNYFYNFKPIAEIKDQSIHTLSLTEQENLLPESQKGNINLSYNRNNDSEVKLMGSLCKDKKLLVFQFSQSDLESNYMYDGSRNPTGYRVQAIESIISKKIQPLYEYGVFYVVNKSDLRANSNFRVDASVEIDDSIMPYLQEKDKVFVEYSDFWAGPYEVGYNDLTSSYYVKPRIQDNKFTVSGYSRDTLSPIELTSNSGWLGSGVDDLNWSIIMPSKDLPVAQKDLISNEELIASFQDSLQQDAVKNGAISFDNITSFIDNYDSSVLSGANLSEEIRQGRLDRLKAILTDEKDIDNTLRQITSSFCDLLVKYKDQENVESWLESLINKHPELIDQMKDARSIRDRIEQNNQELQELQRKKDSLTAEIEQKRDEVNRIDQAAERERKKEFEQKFEEDSRKYQENLKKLGLSDEGVKLQEKVKSLEEDYKYGERRNEELKKKNEELDAEGKKLRDSFKSYIDSAKDKMINIAFDPYRSSKMLQAAASWEQQENEKQYAEILQTVSTLSIDEKTPDELIQYLCRAVQMERPNYSRNTILNIAICVTQGFLTIFSGEPGCGKTSICNILGKVMGLNDIANAKGLNRYINVSVERGWSSKRDFIGYYNPLSKQYDKSNRKIYDALHLLNEEKQQHIAKLPFLVLLDEANLSPMEYYWSDFMNICDDLDDQSEINLGEDFVFGVPETLHFLATINNDQTTEALSPRLIDRAWIITLPVKAPMNVLPDKILSNQIETISWGSLKNAFLPTNEDYSNGWINVSKVYDTILSKLKEQRIIISPRVEKSIRKYWSIASKYFHEDETKTEPQFVALDYAIAQRILPKLSGSGEDFGKWIGELKDICSSNGLNMSKRILDDMLDRGNRQMHYYSFFY